MKNKMIHYKGYFLLALVFVFTATVLGTFEQQAFPLFAVGIVFLVIGSIKVAKRNALVKNNDIV